MDDNHNAAKAAWTVQNHRIHNFIFCFLMKLTDNWHLEINARKDATTNSLCMQPIWQQDKPCTAAQSNLVQSKPSYLRDVAKFIGRFRDIDPPDELPFNRWQKSRPINSKSTQQSQTMGNGTEQTRAIHIGNAIIYFNKANKIRLIVVSKDSLLIGPYAICMQGVKALNDGCKPIPATTTHHWTPIIKTDLGIHMHLLWKMCNAKTKQNKTNQLLRISEVLTYPNNVGSIHLRFKEQKNSENGEKKLFVRNTDKPQHLCFVANFMQILKKACNTY